MSFLTYESKRFVLTAECKISAFLAKKFKSFWTMELLRKKLEKRDNLLCREAKFCMNKVVDWQRRAQKCIVAHSNYEQLKKAMDTKEKQNADIHSRKNNRRQKLQKKVQKS